MTWKGKGIKVIVVLSIILSLILVFFNVYFSKIRYTKIPQDDESLGIKKEDVQQEPQLNIQDNQVKVPTGEAQKSETTTEDKKNENINNDAAIDEDIDKSEYNGKIINIVLLGGDRRSKNEVSHADSVIVLSVDNIHKKIKMSSIMRDTYVNVHGHGKTKLAHAYSYGGPVLTIRTLNENFKLGIRDFVFIDFYGFEKLIDSLDGIEIEIKEYEVRETNKYIKEIASIRKVRPTLIKKAGVQYLNGQQALAYSRIRYVGNGDYERTERQRRVLSAMFQKIKAAGPLKYPVIAANILPYVETNLSKTDILKMGMYILTSDINEIQEQRFPMDGYYKGKFIDKVWYIVTDINQTRKQMHKFIYEK